MDFDLLGVNGLSDMGVNIELTQIHPRAPVTGVTLGWWCKEEDDFEQPTQSGDAPTWDGWPAYVTKLR